MRLWMRYIGMILRSQMQYRLSSTLLFIAQFLSQLTLFLGGWLLFRRFGTLGGWTFYEVALFYSVMMVSFGIAEMVFRGFDVFSNLIRTGNFDRLMLRPQPLELQVLGSEFDWTRLGKLTQGGLALAVALSGLDIPWTFGRIAALVLSFLGGVGVFGGIMILVSTICFWTVQGVEVANLLTDGGRQMGQYPMTIYRDWFRRFFTYVVPLALVNHIPLRYVLARGGGPWSILAPVGAIVFILPCLAVWRIGVRHYKSTGS
ncbi:MAG: ABC-2 family transporter protein [Clostridia bacterium]|nr:ABC-2 family transporter protein [Clostridia bacterium]